jgi:hypothetical protein
VEVVVGKGGKDLMLACAGRNVDRGFCGMAWTGRSEVECVFGLLSVRRFR